MYFEKTYTVDTRDIDCFDCCRASALLGYLQDAAGLASAQFGATNYQMIDNYHHCWMVVRTAFRVDKPIRWADALTVKTWHRGGDKPLMYRDFDLSVNGEKVGEALTVWVLADLTDHSLSRASDFPEFAHTDGGELIRDTKLPRFKLPAGLAPLDRRTLRYSDTDSNGHVNNTRYADFMCDALGLASAPRGTFVRELYLNYQKECRAGEVLHLSGADDGPRRCVLGADPRGEARFQGYVVLGG